MKTILSIIIPTFNSLRTLRELLDSIFIQSCEWSEVVVVDGGSTDGTLSLLSEYGDGIRYMSELDNGIYDAMNKGVAMAKGEWVYFIGADDSLYDSDALNKLLSYLKSDTDMVLCDIMSPTLGRCSSHFSSYTYFTNTIHHQGAVYRKSILEQHPYDASFSIVADYELNLFLWHNKYRIAYADFILANHSPEGVSGKVNTINYKEEILARNRYLSNGLQKAFFFLISWSKYSVKPLVNWFRRHH